MALHFLAKSHQDYTRTYYSSAKVRRQLNEPYIRILDITGGIYFSKYLLYIRTILGIFLLRNKAIYVAFRGKSQQLLLDVQWGEMFFEGASAYSIR